MLYSATMSLGGFIAGPGGDKYVNILGASTAQ
jgi:hypothetical protein